MKYLKYSALGKRLKAEREKKKITQEQLAEMVGCSTAHISHIETANTIPSLKVIIDIVNKLQISSDAILCDYLEKAEVAYKNEMNDIIDQCTESEVRFIVEAAKENLHLLRKYDQDRRKK